MGALVTWYILCNMQSLRQPGAKESGNKSCDLYRCTLLRKASRLFGAMLQGGCWHPSNIQPG
jgi:hypothetical protein